MRTMTLSHPSLVEDIIITMDGTRGYSESMSGFKTSFQDDSGEDEIFDIAYGWLEWQSYAQVHDNDPLYTGHKYWTSQYTPEERRKLINKHLFHK